MAKFTAWAHTIGDTRREIQRAAEDFAAVKTLGYAIVGLLAVIAVCLFALAVTS